MLKVNNCVTVAVATAGGMFLGGGDVVGQASGVFTWTYDLAPGTRIDGFRLYDQLVDIIAEANPTVRALNVRLPAGDYTFTMTAFNATQESLHSAPIIVSIPVLSDPELAPVLNLAFSTRIFSFYDWDAAVPLLDDFSDGRSYELGTRFTVHEPGTVEMLSFWLSPAEPGPHVGRLCTPLGVELGSWVFPPPVAAGWQQVSIDPPVALQVGKSYVISVNTEAAFPSGALPAYQVGDPLEYVEGVIGLTPGSCPGPDASSYTYHYMKDLLYSW